jgi:Asp-tRNA(Asn)/Glu-tRNA(Gln) amidotransferase A subunit family amidase
MSSDPATLTATGAIALLSRNELSSEALVRACLARIETREADVGAWAYLDPENAISQARACDAAGRPGPLHGVPVAFKDVVDTADLPTAYGSRIHTGHRPALDAACVSLTRRAGGVVMGKTVTTEFAGRFAGATANPHDPARTPGGSSSGSAAAVADRHVPLAVGTQTAGSMIRPSAYCGVYGLKPTFGAFNYAGVKHLSERLDTLGIMARALDDIVLFRAVLAGIAPAPVEPIAAAPRIGFCRTPYWDMADPATHRLLEEGVSRLEAAGAQIVDFDLPDGYGDLTEPTWGIVGFDMARALAPEYDLHRDGLSTRAREMIEHGSALSAETYLAYVQTIERAKAEVDRQFADSGIDAILTPSAVGEAHVGHIDTGPVHFNFLWHDFEMPAITIPAFTGPNGMPIGAQLVGRRHADVHLLAVAGWVDPRIRG